MNCKRAKELIDLKLADTLTPSAEDGVRVRASDASPDKPMAALDVHLGDCGDCAVYHNELAGTRNLLADLAADGPTEHELNTTLAALQSADPTGVGEAAGWPPPTSTQDLAFRTQHSALSAQDLAVSSQHSAVSSQPAGCTVPGPVPARPEVGDGSPPPESPTSPELHDSNESPRIRRGRIPPVAAAALAIAACLAIAYTIGDWHYDAERWSGHSLARAPQAGTGGLGGYQGVPNSPANESLGRRARRARGAVANEGQIDQETSKKLASMGYVGSLEPDTPAADDEKIVEPPHMRIQMYDAVDSAEPPGTRGDRENTYDWSSTEEISFGYEVPLSPELIQPSENLDTRMGITEDVGQALTKGEGLGLDPGGYLNRGSSDAEESFGRWWRQMSTEDYRPLGSDGDGSADFPASYGSRITERAQETPDDESAIALASQDAQPYDTYTLQHREDARDAVSDLDMIVDALWSDSDSKPEVDYIPFTNVVAIRGNPEDTDRVKELIAEIVDKPTEKPKATPSDPQKPIPADESQKRKTASAPVRRAPAKPRPKIIKTGELGLAVPEYEPAYQRVQAVVRQFQAFVADVNTQERTGGAITGRVAIRVVPDEFEPLFDALKPLGRVESENVKAADVTAKYVDLEARIRAAQITEARLHELVKSKSIIDKMSAVLEVERELSRVRVEIERMQGQLRVMADRVALSTLTVTLREPDRIVPSATLSVEVPVLDEAADALGAALEQRGGRLTSGKLSRRDDGTFRGDCQLEVPLAQFDAVLAAIESLGRVEDRQITDRQFTDASAPWADEVECKLAVVLYESAGELPQGEITLEVEAVGPAVKQLHELLDEHDGSVRSNRTQRRDDGSSAADLMLLVPAGRYAAFTTALDALGRTTAKRVAGETGVIHGGMADVLCGLSLKLAERPRQVPSGNMTVEVDDFETARQQISALVSQHGVQVLASSSTQRSDGSTVGRFRLGIEAADMESAVARLESLGRVHARSITGVGLGDLSTVDPNALGVIDVSLNEKAAIAPAPDRAGDSIRARLTDGLAALYASLGLIVYGLMTMAPWLIIVLLAAWLIARRLRRHRLATEAKA